ncbi:MAG: EamA family transporter [Clostridia bacterium]|nr:EamA family transporter [Clostridia bacterium]
MGYVLLIGATVLLALNFSATKLHQIGYGSGLRSGLAFSALVGLFTTLVFGFAIHPSMFGGWYSLLMSALMSAAIAIYTLIGFRLMADGTVAMYTVFLMLGGMLMPFFWGLLFLDETTTWRSWAGLVLILVGILLMYGGAERLNRNSLLWLLAVFFLNGLVSIVSKEHQIHSELATATTTGFVWLSGLWRFIFCGGLYLALRKRDSARGEWSVSATARRRIPLPLIALLSVIFSGLSMFMQLHGAKNLPATMLYPVVSGGTILFTALASFLLFGERMSRKSLWAVCLCLLGTLLFV